MSFFDKAKQAASKGLAQAQQSASGLSRQVSSSTGGMSTSSLGQNFTLEKECAKAATILQSFLADPGHPQSALNSIPREVLRRAKGLAIFTIVKAGFVWSAKAGTGIVIARLPGGEWSAPSCIGSAGLGVGLQIGADLSEFVVVLNGDEAVKAFSKGGNVTIGGNLQASAGPIGTGGAINSALINPAPMFSYSRSKGLFAGLSLEGAVLVERAETNAAFYGTKIPAHDLLAGKVPPPAAAEHLYDVIEAAEALNEGGLPKPSYAPGQPEGQPLFDANRHN